MEQVILAMLGVLWCGWAVWYPGLYIIERVLIIEIFILICVVLNSEIL